MDLPPYPGEDNTSSLRRRRRRRVFSAAGSEDGPLENLLAHLLPTFDFLLFSLLASAILAIALFFDSPALFFLAAVAAPYLGPLLGFTLALVAGSPQAAGRALLGLLISAVIIFAGGALSGWLYLWLRPGLSENLLQPLFHTRFGWDDLLILTVAVAGTVILQARNPQSHPQILSAVMAYELYIPVGVAGFSLTTGQMDLLQGGAVLAGINLGWAVLVGLGAMLLTGLRPPNRLGFASIAVMGTACLLLASMFFSAVLRAPQSLPEKATPTLSPTAVPVATLTPTFTAIARPSPTLTTTLTPTPPPAAAVTTQVASRTATITYTPLPTPVWAKVRASEGGGVVIRQEPRYDSNFVTTLINDTLVQILPDLTRTEGVTWVRVRAPDGKEGWLVRSLLVTATPVP